MLHGLYRVFRLAPLIRRMPLLREEAVMGSTGSVSSWEEALLVAAIQYPVPVVSGPGDIQVMSTGSGIYHSEFNDSKTENLEFLQIWIIPRVNNTKPVYKSYDIRQVDMKNRFGYIVAPDGTAPGGILQDAWFALGKLEKGKKIGYHLHQKNTGVYCFVIEGEICIEGTDLSRRDGMGITETDHFQVEARSEAYVLLIEVAMI